MSNLPKIERLPCGAQVEKLPTCDVCKRPINLCGSLGEVELEGDKKTKSWICESCGKSEKQESTD